MANDEFSALEASIASEVDAFDSKARAIAQGSQNRYRMSMEAGQTMPAFGEYDAPDELGRERMQEARAAAYDEIVGAIDRRISSVRMRRTAPANADDVATVTLACSRENIGEDELVALFERYGSNYQLGAAIVERASKAHVLIPGAAAFRVDRQEAVRRAYNVVHNRHTAGGFLDSSPDSVANYVLDGLTHRNLFGQEWSW